MPFQRKSVTEPTSGPNFVFFLVALLFFLIKAWISGRRKEKARRAEPLVRAISPPPAPAAAPPALRLEREKEAVVKPPEPIVARKRKNFLKNAIIAKEILKRRF